MNNQCRLGVAEQLNQASGELDLSQLYGYNKDDQNRMKSGSFLKSNGEFLPFAENRSGFCVSETGSCYTAGDSRVNANPYTIILYTIFLRHHNRIASRMAKEDPNQSDDEIFARAKELNTKMYRHIIFKEWLPILMGTENMRKLSGEKLVKQDSELLEVSNEFAVAAARFYYSMIPNSQKKNSNGAIIFDLDQEFYASSLVDENFNDQVKGILYQKALAMDSTYSNSVRISFFYSH